MKIPEILNRALAVPRLTPTRIVLALAVAVLVDTAQFFTGPLGWALADQLLDLVAMLLTTWIIGFHILLLPTFVVELMPVVDMLPTWTACVLAVVALRRREQRSAPPALPQIKGPPQ